jgi:lysine-N-methylase
MAHRADGACVFLDDDGKCRIHARFGEPAKPLPCRLYPFRFVPLGTQVRVDIRYDCPASASNAGRALPGHRPALLRLLDQVLPPGVAELAPPPLYGKVQPSWAQLCRITETFERLLLQSGLGLTPRVVCCVNFAAVLRSPRIITLEGHKLSEYLDTISQRIIADIFEHPLTRVAPPALVRTALRQLAGLYGRLDARGEKVHLLARLRTSVTMATGRGRTPRFREDFPPVTFAEIENLASAPTDAAAEVFTRYLHMRLTSMSFYGRTFYNLDYLEGMNALLLTYPLLCWFARALAVGKQLSAPDEECAVMALQIVDHQHGISPILNLPNERYRRNFLCERSHLRRLAIWYGS